MAVPGAIFVSGISVCRGLIYAACSIDQFVAVVDATTFTLVGKITTTISPNSVVVVDAGALCRDDVMSESLLVITDWQPHQVVVCTMTGTHVCSIGTQLGELRRPRGLCEHSGLLYVVDGKHRVVVYRLSDGSLIRRIGAGQGSLEAQFKWPIDVCVVGEMLFITDQHNDRVQVMSLQGGFLFTWGSRGSAPCGIHSDGSVVFVAELHNNRVQLFSLQGHYLTGIACEGPAAVCTSTRSSSTCSSASRSRDGDLQVYVGSLGSVCGKISVFRRC
jgi:DNA-binding beta-propeller fold protein YncE